MSLESTPAPVRDDVESNGQITPAGPAIVGSGFDASRATTPIVMALGMASIFADVFKQVPAGQYGRKSTACRRLAVQHSAKRFVCSVQTSIAGNTHTIVV